MGGMRFEASRQNFEPDRLKLDADNPFNVNAQNLGGRM
jgi:hypothetical protein